MSILQLLGIKHPVLLAPMAGVSTPELAAEVSNQGGLGSLGLGAASVEAARKQITETKSLTDASFQVNFFCHESVEQNPQITQQWIKSFSPLFEKFNAAVPENLNCIYPSFKDNDDFLNLVLETSPQAVSFHFGIPHPHQIQALKAAGIITIVSATNIAEARMIEQAGIDIIIAQGIEAGGHRGIFNESYDSAVQTADLVRLCKKYCSIPVVAAGGIMNGQQARLMLQTGADAVQMGTAFVQCKSSAINDAYRKALFSKPATQITASISGRPARGIINHWHCDIDQPDRLAVPAYPYAYDLGKQLHAAATKAGDSGYGAFWAGTNVAQIRDMDARDLMNQLILEMNLT
jgi:nitronate monooxygenase